MWMNVNKASVVLLVAGTILSGTEASAGQGGAGEQVYEKVCSHCHEAGVGPKIKGRELPVQYIERVVRFGNQAMPSFRPSEINTVALGDLAKLISGNTSIAIQLAP